MPVSPRDFELYSRMTGKPMPMDAQQRMQMAPEVFQFTRNFAKKPNIFGKTTLMGAAGLAAAPAFVEQQETTADNYDQDRVENQTASNQIMRSGVQTVDLEEGETVAKDLTEDQYMGNPMFRPTQIPTTGALHAATPVVASGLSESGNEVNVIKGVEEEVVGSGITSDKVQNFLNKMGGTDEGSKLDAALLGAIQDRDKKERFYLGGELHPDDNPVYQSKLESLRSPITDNPQSAIDGGQSTRAESREFIKETEPIDSGVPTNVDPSTLTPEVKAVLSNIAQGMATIPLEKQIQAAKEMVDERNMMESPNEAIGKLKAEIDKKEQANQNLLDFVKTLGGEPTQEQKIEADQANSRILQKTAAKNRQKGNINEKFYPTDVARTDIQVGGMQDRKTGLGRSVGISYTPMNGDTKVGFNMMSDPTKPQDVKTYEFTASPEAMQSMQSQEEGELGSETFGKLFNIAKKKQQGFGGLET